jgi:hypothetical protein
MKRTIGVKVIQPAHTPIDNWKKTDSRLDNLPVSTEREGLGSNTHSHGKRTGPSGRIKNLNIPTRVNSNCGWLCKCSNHKHSILHCLPPIRAAVEIVTTAIIGWYHTRVGGVAVDSPWSRPIPVNEKIFGNIAIHGATGSTVLVGSDKWLGHVHPAIVGPRAEMLEWM